MDYEDFYKRHEDMLSWDIADQYLVWAWFLTVCEGKETFTGADVCGFYEALGLSVPPSLKTKGGDLRLSGHLLGAGINIYKLERRTRDALDKKFGSLKQRESTVAVIEALTNLPRLMPNLVERAYLDEALLCFKHGAFRAAVVMAWNLAYDHLCEYVLANKLAEFNAQLPKSFPKADVSSVSKRDDFARLKESQVIQVCNSANIVSGNEHKVLKDKLDRRNIAAHPSGVGTSQLTAEQFIDEIIREVVVKLR